MRFKVGFYSAISFLLFIILFSSIASSSTDPLIWNETKVSAHESCKDGLTMYGDKILWIDFQGNYDIYMYDLSTSKETKITNNPTAYATRPDFGFCIYDDKIVSQGLYGDGIYIYNISTSLEGHIPGGFSSKRHPAIYENVIVWEDYRNEKMNEKHRFKEGGDIYMYNPTSNKTWITHSGSATNPAIYGDRIVWSDNRNDNKGDIYLYNLSTSNETRITYTGGADYPKIYGDRIVWQDNRNGDWNIYMYDLSTSNETPITNSGKATLPAIYGDRIVWEDSYSEDGHDDGWLNSKIYMYDISTSTKTLIATSNVPSIRYVYPAIYGNKISWIAKENNGGNETNDIYTADIDSDPQVVVVPPANNTTGSNVTNRSNITNGSSFIPMPKLSNEGATILAALITALGGILVACINKKKE